MKVIIPAACYNVSQLDAASFVFKTIRTGFPTADIVLVIGNTVPTLRDAIIEAAVGAGVNPARNDIYARARPTSVVSLELRSSDPGYMRS